MVPWKNNIYVARWVRMTVRWEMRDFVRRLVNVGDPNPEIEPPFGPQRTPLMTETILITLLATVKLSNRPGGRPDKSVGWSWQ